MATFTLLSALGNGSGRIATHHRFPLAAYQSGSVLVLWDYVKATGAAQKFVPLQPNQHCDALFFSRDAQFVLGFWLSQQSHVMFTVWRVADGTKVAEHGLSDKVGGSKVMVDYRADLNQFVILHSGEVASATIIHWGGPADRPHYVAHGHVGAQHDVISVQLLDDGQHFTICTAMEVSFWSFVEQMPRMALQVMLDKPLKSCTLLDHHLYLVPQQGRVRIMDFAGQLEDYSIPPAESSSSSSVSYTAITARGSCLCLGDTEGMLHIHDLVRMQHTRQLPPPEELGSPASFVSALRAVRSISFGMNDDYLCVCFADGTYGVVHLDTGQYVSVRIGHRSIVRGVAMAPDLQLPPGLASRLLDPDRVLISRAIAFVSIAEDTNWITWPRRGAPTRCSAFAFSKPPPVKDPLGLELEVYIPRPLDESLKRGSDADWLRGPPLVLTAVAFHPTACLSPTGDLGGAYRMIVGAIDGCLHALESVEENAAAMEQLRWRTLKVREKPRYDAVIDANRTLPPAWLPQVPPTWLQGVAPGELPPQPACCHVSFSRCGRFAAASFCDGYAEMLHYPSLEQALVLNPSGSFDQSVPSRHTTASIHYRNFLAARKTGLVHAKAVFASHPLDDKKYDQNIYAVCHTLEPQVLVLYEVYPFGGDWNGNRYAKNTRAEYRLPAEPVPVGASDAPAQGIVSDFAVHPSNLYLVVSMTWPSLQRRPVILIFDLWVGDLLAQSPIFTSLLITPATPLQPQFCIDASGTFMYVASSPLVVGSMDEVVNPTPSKPSWIGSSAVSGMASLNNTAAPYDSVRATSTPWSSAHYAQQTSSVVCVLDFASGRQVYQSSAEVTSIAVGSLGGDPTQLILGSADGSISVWHPPEAVQAQIKQMLQSSTHSFLQQRQRLGGEQLTPDELQYAVSLYWASYLARSMNWKAWGEDPTPQPAKPSRLAQSDSWLHTGLNATAALDRHNWQESSRSFSGHIGAPLVSSEDDDVVVQARKRWLPTAKPTPQGLAPSPALSASGVGGFERNSCTWAGVRPSPLPRQSNGYGGSKLQSPPVHIHPPQPQPAPLRGVGQEPRRAPCIVGQTANGDAELVVTAPELHEKFGSLPEHFEDPVPTGQDIGLPSWLVNTHRKVAMQVQQPNPVEEAREFKVVESFFGDIEQFEKSHPYAQVLDSPRSDAGGPH